MTVDFHRKYFLTHRYAVAIVAAMPFVKLDCGILNSTIWIDFHARILFITALLMAEPREYRDPIPQINVRSLELTGWTAPPGWYGYVPAAGSGIVRRADIELEKGLDALERLGSPERESRSAEFEGRRMIRIDGGYLILNYQRYRDKDYTAAERSKRYRERKASRRDNHALHRDITQAEAEAEAIKSEESLPEDFPSLAFANKVAEQLCITDHGMNRVIAGAIDWLVKFGEKNKNSAVAFLIEAGKDAQQRGERMRFWFQDRGWIPKQKKNGADLSAYYD